MAQLAPAKHWCFTSFNELIQFNSSTMQYLVYQRELSPSSMKEHLQGYVVFLKKQRLTALKKLMPTAHWEIARGTPTENKAYCTKDASRCPSALPCEYGSMPSSIAAAVSLSTKRRWDDAFAAAEAGDFSTIPKDMLTRYYRTYKQIRVDAADEPAQLDHTTGVWIYGPSGVGKTRLCQEYPHYKKNQNKWWCGYKGQDTVVIDDLDPENARCLKTHLKLWGDGYTIHGEQKGTSILLRPKCIIITSNYTPAQIFTDDGILLSAIERRFVPFEFITQEHEIRTRIDTLLAVHD